MTTIDPGPGAAPSGVDLNIECRPAGARTVTAQLQLRDASAIRARSSATAAARRAPRDRGLHLRAITTGAGGGRREVALVVPALEVARLREALNHYAPLEENELTEHIAAALREHQARVDRAQLSDDEAAWVAARATRALLASTAGGQP